MATTLRMARMADLERLVDALQAAGSERGRVVAREDLGRRVAPALADPRRGLAWFIERGGEPAGCAVLEFGAADVQPRFAYVACLWVAPGYRGQGVGETALLLMRGVCDHLGWRLADRGAEALRTEQKPITPSAAGAVLRRQGGTAFTVSVA